MKRYNLQSRSISNSELEFEYAIFCLYNILQYLIKPMGKKIRYQYLTGSLKKPLFQFVNKMEFSINPMSDPRGTAIANHWYRMSKAIKPKFKAENFDSQINYDLTSSSSYVIMNFVNGWKQGFYFRESTNAGFINQTKMTNQFVELQRALQGYEDQYEDED